MWCMNKRLLLIFHPICRKSRSEPLNQIFVFSAPLSAPEERSCQRRTQRWGEKERSDGGREGEERNTEGEACSEKYGEESGREKMDEEPHCECCLRMFIKPEK